MTVTGYRPWRVPLQIRYEGREFGSISLEVAIDGEAGRHHDLVEPDGIELALFDIHPPRMVPCLDVPHQVAQKLHACTEPIPDGNDRVRDIIDIWLLEALLEPGDLAAVRTACIEVFQRRRRQTWRPDIVPSTSWKRDYPLLVADHPDAPPTLDDAIDYVTQFVVEIDRAQ